MNENDREIAAEQLFVGIARDIRWLREAVTIAVIALVLVAIAAVFIYQRHASAGAAGGAAAAKG
ncbi:MAG: hypothetical protein M0R37_12605 [Bacteroidales bacterium]|nr:hypothetical protein [Bacteroidales bacterium]